MSADLASPRPRGRVLLAEDDRFLRKAAETALRARGFAVTTAIDGEQALKLATSERPDLILLDLIMPKLNGFEVLRRLKEDTATAAIPVLVLSNLSQERDIERASGLGAVEYLVKANLSLATLMDRVEAALAPSAH